MLCRGSEALSDGRGDRVIPMLSQAILQAQAHALDADGAQPLAVIYVDNAPRSLARQFLSFGEKYAPNVAVGLVSTAGLRCFRGQGLEELNAEQDEPRWHHHSPTPQPANLFSDLNQWMLKVLLAPEIPVQLLHAPRQRYYNGAELAQGAATSAMSASRFL